jgi:isopropanol dehydrogenase (NADP+)
MKTFVMKAIGQVGFMGKPIPQPGPNDAIVKTTRALICTSDSHTVGGAVGPRENLTLGHEAVGIVQEVGSNVKLFKPGDRVLVGAITPDWGDPASQAGHSSQSGALWEDGNSPIPRKATRSTRSGDCAGKKCRDPDSLCQGHYWDR